MSKQNRDFELTPAGKNWVKLANYRQRGNIPVFDQHGHRLATIEAPNWYELAIAEALAEDERANLANYFSAVNKSVDDEINRGLIARQILKDGGK